MSPHGIISVCLSGIGHILNTVLTAIVILLIIRSLLSHLSNRSGFASYSFYSYLKPYFRITDILVNPVRTILPRQLRELGFDYSPLVSAILLLFIGFGINSFFKIIFD